MPKHQLLMLLALQVLFLVQMQMMQTQQQYMVQKHLLLVFKQL
jgi:hypothetical protein